MKRKHWNIGFNCFGRRFCFGFKFSGIATLTTRNGKFFVPIGILCERDDSEEPTVVVISFVFFWFQFVFGYTEA